MTYLVKHIKLNKSVKWDDENLNKIKNFDCNISPDGTEKEIIQEES